MDATVHKRNRLESSTARSLTRIAQNGVIKVVAAGLAFASQITLVKILGSGPYGLYVYLVTYCSLIVAISKGGIDLVALRETAVAWSAGSLQHVKSIRRGAFRYIVAIGAPAAVLLAFVFEKTGISAHGQRSPELIWVVITSITLLVLAMSLACVKGMQRVTSAEAVDSIFKPVTIIAIAWLIGSMSVVSPSYSAYVPFIAANVVSALALQILFYAVQKENKAEVTDRKVEVRGLFEPAQAFSMTLSGLITFAYFQLDTLIVATKLGASEAASYNMACNFVRVVIFVALIASGQAQPVLAAQYRRNDMNSVRRTIWTCVLVSVSSAALGAVFLLIFGQRLLGAVSPGFVTAYTALIILSVAHVFNSVILGLTGALNMCGFQNNVLKAQIIGLVPGAIGMLFLVTPYGMNGVALSVLMALVMNFLVLTRDCRRVFSVQS